MKKVILSIICLIFTQMSFGQENNTQIEGFIPQIIAQFPNVRDVTLSPSEDEIYFTAQSYLGELSAIVCLERKNKKYGKPKIAAFSGKYHDLEPFLSPDGLRLFFSSNRPLEASSKETKDYDIWFVERKTLTSAWSEAINMGYPINTKDNEFYPSISKFNNLYFTSDGANSKGKDDIFVSKWNDGKYDTPVSMSDAINSEGIEFNAFISPDETYLLYTCYNRKDGFGSGDIYVSYHKENDEWTKAENLGEKINSSKMDYCPFVNIKSGILYFTSKRNTINTKFDEAQNIEDLVKKMNTYENGLSRLYQIKFDKFKK